MIWWAGNSGDNRLGKHLGFRTLNIKASIGRLNCTQQPRWSDGQLMGIGILVRKEGPAGRWQYPTERPFPLDAADALQKRRHAVQKRSKLSTERRQRFTG